VTGRAPSVRGAALTALPLVVAGQPVATPASADPGYVTSVDLDDIASNPVAYGTTVSIRGQVVYTDPEDGRTYATEGPVTLEQRNYGEVDWQLIDSTDMSGFFPAFDFDVVATRIATYRVSYLGEGEFLPSTDSLLVKVSRKVTGRVTEPRDNVYVLSGQVRPSYAGQPISLMRQKCSSCAWRVYTSQLTTTTSGYRFRLPLPRSGIHYFRARVPADGMFVKSFSPTWHLIRIL
jgi:hypothetical protein